jgi:hypothetical protein
MNQASFPFPLYHARFGRTREIWRYLAYGKTWGRTTNEELGNRYGWAGLLGLVLHMILLTFWCFSEQAWDLFR